MNISKSVVFLVIAVLLVVIGFSLYQSAVLQSTVESSNKIQQKSNNSLITSDESSWQAYSQDGFTMLIPSDWNEVSNNRVGSKNEPAYFIQYGSSLVDDIKDERVSLLLKAGKLKETEQLRIDSACKETNRCGGKITQVRNLDINDGSGIEVVSTYQSMKDGKKEGTITELNYLILRAGKFYRFTAMNMPNNTELSPSPVEMSREILVTLKFD